MKMSLYGDLLQNPAMRRQRVYVISSVLDELHIYDKKELKKKHFECIQTDFKNSILHQYFLDNK